jgi:hypothetical protein
MNKVIKSEKIKKKIIQDLKNLRKEINDLDFLKKNYKKEIFNLNIFLIQNNLEIIRFINSLNYNFNNQELKNLFISEKKDLLFSLKNLRKLILEDLILFENDINHLLKIKKDILILINGLERHILVIFNMSIDFENFIYDLNIKNFKKLSLDNLKPGDIILVYKKNKLINKYFFYKMIKKESNSNFLHSFLYYGYKNKKHLFVDTEFDIRNNFNLNSVFNLKELNFKKNEYCLVLRINNGLNKEEIIKFYNIINKEIIGKKYGFFKTIFLGISLELFRKFNSLFKLKNNFELNKYYCSEMVISVYEKLGYDISFKYYNSTTLPVDILNINQFNIIGVLDTIR